MKRSGFGQATIGLAVVWMVSVWGCEREPEPRLEPGVPESASTSSAATAPPPEGGGASDAAASPAEVALILTSEGEVTSEQLEAAREVVQARAEVIVGPSASITVTVELPSRLRVAVSGDADAAMLSELGTALTARGRLQLTPMVARYDEQKALDALAELAESADQVAYSEGYLVVPGEDTDRPPSALRAIAEAHRDLWPEGQRVVYERAPSLRVDPPGAARGEAVRWRMRLVQGERTLASPGIVSAQVETSAVDGTTHVAVELDKDAAGAFHSMTRSMVGEQLAIVIDDVVVSAPVVREPISEGRLWIQPGVASGLEDQRREAQVLAGLLQSELAVTLTLESLAPR